MKNGMHQDIELIYYTGVPSPLGDILVASSEAGVCRVAIPNESPEDFFAWLATVFGPNRAVFSKERLRPATDQLLEYLAGHRRTFDLAMDLHGTAFQQRVWHQLLRIPYGETRSYQEIAAAAGFPGAYRAVGGAVGRNPLPLIVPCHRVIGKDGSLTGFSSGLDAKRFLLRREGLLC